MQTFLPYKDFVKSVRCLDNKRLGKQRVEAYQILLTLQNLHCGYKYRCKKCGKKYGEKLNKNDSMICLEKYDGILCGGKIRKIGWLNHPAIRMWYNYEDALIIYFNDCVDEWVRRGFVNNMNIIKPYGKIIYPKWLGNKDFHLSHKSNLLRKDYMHYNKYFKNVPNDLPYIWFDEKGKRI